MGSGSAPPELKGWQRKTLFVNKANAFIMLCFLKACIPYSEHVRSNRQLEPRNGDRQSLYVFINKIKNIETDFLIKGKNKTIKLGRQDFPAAFSTPSKNTLATHGRHSKSESVFVFSFSLAWLVSPLHFFSSNFSRQNYFFLAIMPR